MEHVPKQNKIESIFITSPEIHSRIIASNELAFAFPTNIPITPGHVLICPKRSARTIYELTAEEISKMFELMQTLRGAIQTTFGAAGFNYAWNEGEVAGQSVPHVHIHMVPRKNGDTGITEYEPRKFLYRPGSREETPEAELLKVAQLIKSAIL